MYYNLKEFIKKVGEQNITLCKKMELSESQLSHLCTGHSEIRFKHIFFICEEFNTHAIFKKGQLMFYFEE